MTRTNGNEQAEATPTKAAPGNVMAGYTIPKTDPARFEQAKQAESRREQAEREQRLKAFYRDVGSRYAKCRLANFELHGGPEDRKRQQAVLDQLRAYLTDPPDDIRQWPGIVAIGPVGTGKDHLAAAAARAAIIKHGKLVAWTDGTRLFSQLRDGMSGDASENGILRPLMSADILILSDPVPPKSELTTWQRGQLSLLVDRRYRDEKPIWLTCNFENTQDAVESLAGSIVDRLRDGSLVLDCSWPSHRAPLSLQKIGSTAKASP